ncbi:MULTISPECIES: C2H2-type zinc finger protein [unclassified Methanosarcina]|nr:MULTISPECIES: C2H2-type zinc finger protein [unclassified Methanosarcina]
MQESESEEQKFECSVCHMTFATRAEYEKHMREKHNR